MIIQLFSLSGVKNEYFFNLHLRPLLKFCNCKKTCFAISCHRFKAFKAGLSPPVKYFTDRSKAVLLLWVFYVFVLSCVCYVLCASVYMCFVVTCWERADLLALVCAVFCEFVTFPLVSWVRCGT